MFKKTNNASKKQITVSDVLNWLLDHAMIIIMGQSLFLWDRWYPR